MQLPSLQHLLEERCPSLPADGFGAQGKSPDVPPHATLEAHVALISWAKVEQVTKDGGIMKKCLKPSTEYKTPGPESKVKVRWDWHKRGGRNQLPLHLPSSTTGLSQAFGECSDCSVLQAQI